MKPIPGMPPAEVQDLTRVADRISFLYVERAVLNRDSNALTVQMSKGTVHVPAATLAVVLLGPGTNITHRAMCLMADSGATTIWVGEEAVRYYAHGRPLARTSRLLEAQVGKVTNNSSRLAVARQMYEMRFPGEDVSTANMQQLRGREGARVRSAYASTAKDYGIKWRRREYQVEDFDASDDANAALTVATTCLYGVVHAVVAALGCAPGLGFIHTGHDRSFVFDIADLYKTELAVPVAFRIASSDSDDIPGDTRRLMRDEISKAHLLERAVRDVQQVLIPDEEPALADVTYLWDGSDRLLAAGQNYSGEDLPW